MWNIYWRFLPRHNRSAAQKNPVNKVCLLFAFSVPTECAAIATGNDFRGLGICHQQAFSRNSGNGISAKYAILRKIALLADLLTPCIFNEDVVVYIVVSCGQSRRMKWGDLMEAAMKQSQLHDIYFPEKKEKSANLILQQSTDTGTGEMTCYDVAPGIQITYNHLNMDSCYQPLIPKEDFLQIDHCLEGCYECELAGGSVSFLGEGDLSVSNLCKGQQLFVGSRIPLKKYRGITVLLEMEGAQKTLNTDFRQGDINLQQIRDTLCGDGRSLLIKSKHEIDHIFSELYRVDERIRIPYFWIKVIELLLFLSLLDASYVKKPRQFSEDVSKGTQQAYQYIIENPFSKITISQLAEMFHVAESSMKRCFTSIAGNSIGTFMKIKRMEAAAELLVSEPQLSICEVAEAAGYENQSKFSAAFKSIMGVTPFAYRCKSW